MIGKLIRASVIFITLIMASQFANAQQAVIYADSWYNGSAQALSPGWYDWGSIPNDSVSSIRVPAGLKVTLYNDTHFTGNAIAFTQDSYYIGDFNDKTSSILVERIPPPQTTTSYWYCYRKGDGRLVGNVAITWGHQPWDATWACNARVAECAGNGCAAVGNKPGSNSCKINEEPGGALDACSNPLNDPTTNAYKIIFKSACNHHDECYHAPWSLLGSNGRTICNSNFWYDMENICDSTFPSGWQFIERGYCITVAHAWMTAVELAPGAFDNGQAWVRDRCLY